MGRALQQVTGAPYNADDDHVTDADDEGGNDEQSDGDRGQVGLKQTQQNV